MKKFILLLAGGAILAFSAITGFGPEGFGIDRLFNPGLYAKFGNWGGGQRSVGTREPFNPKAIKFGIRWYPTYVNFGPDGDTLLVSLCHVSWPNICRINYQGSESQFRQR